MEADQRGRRLSDLYHAAAAQRPVDREAFLKAACEGDSAMRQEIESLLQYESQSAGFLEVPAVAFAAGGAPRTHSANTMVRPTLGPYAIVSPLGMGGMGEVYRARDSKLGRDVAIKILPPHFTTDPERRARFAREARLLASFNHPNIGAIYGIEESDGVTALVLELVEGPTLADRLESGPLPAAQALMVAGQVADALDAAHAKGIIHRDLKPANIVLQGAAGESSDVRAKVLDFGLAKAVAAGLDGDLAQPPPGSFDGTGDGRILGTPAYMSPEQARGLAVDKRADIWAFGCVLFEMLAGRRAFDGTTATDTLAHVLEREPDWALLPADTPAPLRTMLERCLRKDPRRRLHDIADAKIEIDDWPNGGREPGTRPASRAGVARTWLPWIFVAGIAATGWIAMRNGPGVSLSTADPVEVAMNAPDNARFVGMDISISPDGRHVAFVATSKAGSSLWVRSLNTFEPREIPDTNGARSPFWSPDSSRIAYLQERSLKTVLVTGGSPFTVSMEGPPPTSHSDRAGTWGRDDNIVFGPFPDGGLYRISAKGGTPTPVTVVKKNDRAHRWPSFLDDGRHFLYLAGETAFEVRIGSLAPGAAAEVVGPFESHADYAAGYLFFVRGGHLVAQRFDQEDRKLRGEPIDLGRQTGIEPHNQRGMFAVSPAGALVYRASARTKSHLTWFDRQGFPRGTVGEIGVYFNLDLSPDEHRVAVSRMTEKNGRAEFDIWTIELATGNATRLTDDYPAWQFDPTWSPDGSRIAFNEKPIPTRGSFGLSTIASDGRGETESLVPPDAKPSLTVEAPDWPARDIIVYSRGDGTDAPDLWTIALSGDRKPRLLLDTRYGETHGTVSPDSGWMAYQSNASGQRNVYVRPFSSKEPSHRVSRDGGTDPAWRGDGKELFFLASDRTMMVARFDPRTGRLDAAGPQRLFATSIARGNNHPYAVTRDGQRFLVPVPVDDPPRLVLDWRTVLPR